MGTSQDASQGSSGSGDRNQSQRRSVVDHRPRGRWGSIEEVGELVATTSGLIQLGDVLKAVDGTQVGSSSAVARCSSRGRSGKVLTARPADLSCSDKLELP
eukprot:768432-Hanusia_phi.AAC.4